MAIRITTMAHGGLISLLVVTGFYIADPFTVPQGRRQASSDGIRALCPLWPGVILTFVFFWRVYLAFFSTFHADWIRLLRLDGLQEPLDPDISSTCSSQRKGQAQLSLRAAAVHRLCGAPVPAPRHRGHRLTLAGASTGAGSRVGLVLREARQRPVRRPGRNEAHPPRRHLAHHLSSWWCTSIWRSGTTWS
jgi:hypothetical protein